MRMMLAARTKTSTNSATMRPRKTKRLLKIACNSVSEPATV